MGERIMRVSLAFNELTAEEQRDFADHLAAIMAVGPPVPPLTTFAAEAADRTSPHADNPLNAPAQISRATSDYTETPPSPGARCRAQSSINARRFWKRSDRA